MTVANAKIFDEPIYNYTRDFPYIWDEITLPIAYSDDRNRAEEILLEAARMHALSSEKVASSEADCLKRRDGLDRIDLDPTVFYRITDNWL
ncbi:MAG: mechanosensitive ion channel family protein, partial [Chthoniobacteraceae bacterium]